MQNESTRLLSVTEIMDAAGRLRYRRNRWSASSGRLSAWQREQIEQRILDVDRAESVDTASDIARDFGISVSRVYQLAAEMTGSRREGMEILKRLHAEAERQIHKNGLSPKRANHYLILVASEMRTFMRIAGASR